MNNLINIEYQTIKSLDIYFEVSFSDILKDKLGDFVFILIEHDSQHSKESVSSRLLNNPIYSELQISESDGFTSKYINQRFKDYNMNALVYESSELTYIFSIDNLESLCIKYSDFTKQGRDFTVVLCPTIIRGQYLYIASPESTTVYDELSCSFDDMCYSVEADINKVQLDRIKAGLNMRCLNCLNNNFSICSLPKEFISDILLIDAIDSAIASDNIYILDNIINKFSNIYPYEQYQSKCQLCKQNIS